MTVRGTLSAKSQWEGDLECFTEPTYAHQNQSSHQGGVVWLKKVLLEVHPESSRWNEDYSSKPSAWTGQPNRHGFKSQFCHLPVLASSWPLWSFFLKHKTGITLLGASQRRLWELNKVFQMKCLAQSLIKSECLINKQQLPFHLEWKLFLLMKMPLLSPGKKASRAFLGQETRVRFKTLNDLCGPGLAIQNGSQS